MPTTKEFRQKHGKGKKMSHYKEVVEEKPSRPKRRPGREEPESAKDRAGADEELETAKASGVAFEVEEETAKEAGEDLSQEAIEADAEATPEDRIEIRFRGSELLRARFPKPFELAEEVATQWLKDGDFENLPISHPLGQWAAQQGLLKAKDFEKKLMTSPLVEKAAIRVLTAGMQAQGMVEKLREKLKNRNGH